MNENDAVRLATAINDLPTWAASVWKSTNAGHGEDWKVAARLYPKGKEHAGPQNLPVAHVTMERVDDWVEMRSIAEAKAGMHPNGPSPDAPFAPPVEDAPIDDMGANAAGDAAKLVIFDDFPQFGLLQITVAGNTRYIPVTPSPDPEQLLVRFRPAVIMIDSFQAALELKEQTKAIFDEAVKRQQSPLWIPRDIRKTHDGGNGHQG